MSIQTTFDLLIRLNGLVYGLFPGNLFPENKPLGAFVSMCEVTHSMANVFMQSILSLVTQTKCMFKLSIFNPL